MIERTIVAYDFEGNEYIFSCLPHSLALAIKEFLEDFGLDITFVD